jgi:hypothetical protein
MSRLSKLDRVLGAGGDDVTSVTGSEDTYRGVMPVVDRAAPAASATRSILRPLLGGQVGAGGRTGRTARATAGHSGGPGHGKQPRKTVTFTAAGDDVWTFEPEGATSAASAASAASLKSVPLPVVRGSGEDENAAPGPISPPGERVRTPSRVVLVPPATPARPSRLWALNRRSAFGGTAAAPHAPHDATPPPAVGTPDGANELARNLVGDLAAAAVEQSAPSRDAGGAVADGAVAAVAGPDAAAATPVRDEVAEAAEPRDHAAPAGDAAPRTTSFVQRFLQPRPLATPAGQQQQQQQHPATPDWRSSTALVVGFPASAASAVRPLPSVTPNGSSALPWKPNYTTPVDSEAAQQTSPAPRVGSGSPAALNLASSPVTSPASTGAAWAALPAGADSPDPAIVLLPRATLLHTPVAVFDSAARHHDAPTPGGLMGFPALQRLLARVSGAGLPSPARDAGGHGARVGDSERLSELSSVSAAPRHAARLEATSTATFHMSPAAAAPAGSIAVTLVPISAGVTDASRNAALPYGGHVATAAGDLMRHRAAASADLRDEPPLARLPAAAATGHGPVRQPGMAPSPQGKMLPSTSIARQATPPAVKVAVHAALSRAAALALLSAEKSAAGAGAGGSASGEPHVPFPLLDDVPPANAGRGGTDTPVAPSPSALPDITTLRLTGRKRRRSRPHIDPAGATAPAAALRAPAAAAAPLAGGSAPTASAAASSGSGGPVAPLLAGVIGNGHPSSPLYSVLPDGMSAASAVPPSPAAWWNAPHPWQYPPAHPLAMALPPSSPSPHMLPHGYWGHPPPYSTHPLAWQGHLQWAPPPPLPPPLQPTLMHPFTPYGVVQPPSWSWQPTNPWPAAAFAQPPPPPVPAAVPASGALAYAATSDPSADAHAAPAAPPLVVPAGSQPSDDGSYSSGSASASAASTTPADSLDGGFVAAGLSLHPAAPPLGGVDTISAVPLSPSPAASPATSLQRYDSPASRSIQLAAASTPGGQSLMLPAAAATLSRPPGDDDEGIDVPGDSGAGPQLMSGAGLDIDMLPLDGPAFPEEDAPPASPVRALPFDADEGMPPPQRVRPAPWCSLSQISSALPSSQWSRSDSDAGSDGGGGEQRSDGRRRPGGHAAKTARFTAALAASAGWGETEFASVLELLVRGDDTGQTGWMRPCF